VGSGLPHGSSCNHAASINISHRLQRLPANHHSHRQSTVLTSKPIQKKGLRPRWVRFAKSRFAAPCSHTDPPPHEANQSDSPSPVPSSEELSTKKLDRPAMVPDKIIEQLRKLPNEPNPKNGHFRAPECTGLVRECPWAWKPIQVDEEHVRGRMWRTHSCVPCSHSCEHKLETVISRRRHECRRLEFGHSRN
jgi:hypothetical protein